MFLELSQAIKEITYYVNQRPLKHDVPFWINTRKRLRDRKKELEEYIFNGELDIESYYDMEEIRSQTIDLLRSQGVLKNDSNK